MRNLILLLLTIFNASLSGQNFLATYAFSNVTASTGLTDPGPAPIVENLVMGNFRASNPGPNPGASGRFSFSDWPVGAYDGIDDCSTYTAALSPFVYYEVGMRVAHNHTLDLKSISFNVRRSGTGIRNFCVRSLLDNYSTNVAASTGTNMNLQVLDENVFLWKYDSISTSTDQRGSSLFLPAEFRDLTDTVAFRFFAWNSEAPGGTFSIDNVTFSGYVKDSSFFSGLTDYGLASRTEVFPNPASNVVNVKCNLKIDELELCDLLGKPVVHLFPGSEDASIVISHVQEGLYILKINAGNAVRRITLVVQGR